MSFRVYCAFCESSINPPFWNQYNRSFCNPGHAEKWKAEVESKKTVEVPITRLTDEQLEGLRDDKHLAHAYRVALNMIPGSVESMARELLAHRKAKKISDRALAPDKIREIIDEWRAYWMDQKQNSQADYENYLRRAMGVDANMQYHLAKLISENIKAQIAEIFKHAGEVR